MNSHLFSIYRVSFYAGMLCVCRPCVFRNPQVTV